MTTSPFGFGERPSATIGRRVVSVGDVGNKEDLLAALVAGLRIPEWFGWNWDALEDTLRDLSWLSEGLVTIYHEAVPRLPDDDLRTYLAILSSATHASAGRQPAVEVVFAPDCRRIIARITGHRSA